MQWVGSSIERDKSHEQSHSSVYEDMDMKAVSRAVLEHMGIKKGDSIWINNKDDGSHHGRIVDVSHLFDDTQA